MTLSWVSSHDEFGRIQGMNATIQTAIIAVAAAVAGGLFAHELQFINPRSFTILKSTDMLLMVYLGGIASLGLLEGRGKERCAGRSSRLGWWNGSWDWRRCLGRGGLGIRLWHGRSRRVL